MPCAPSPAQLATASKAKFAATAAAERDLPLPAFARGARHRRIESDGAAGVLEIAAQRQHIAVAVDDAGFRRVQRADAGELRLQRARGIAADQFQALDAVDAALHLDLPDLVELRLVGGDDELAAFAMRHAMRDTEFVEPAPPAHAVAPAQRAGGVIHAAMDDLAVARGNAGTDGVRRFGHHHLVALARGRARHRQPDHAGSDHQDLHAAFCLDDIGSKRFMQLPLNHHLHKNGP